jgi:hypothetical protein
MTSHPRTNTAYQRPPQRRQSRRKGASDEHGRPRRHLTPPREPRASSQQAQPHDKAPDNDGTSQGELQPPASPERSWTKHAEEEAHRRSSKNGAAVRVKEDDGEKRGQGSGGRSPSHPARQPLPPGRNRPPPTSLHPPNSELQPPDPRIRSPTTRGCHPCVDADRHQPPSVVACTSHRPASPRPCRPPGSRTPEP